MCLLTGAGCADMSLDVSDTTEPNALLTGQWQKVSFPSITIAAAALPNGKILTWSSEDRFTWGTGATKTYSALFDPQSMLVQDILVTSSNHEMFCPGTAMLADGRVFVNGGGDNVSSTSIYTGGTGTWAADTAMNQARWYNSSVTLPSGDVFTLGGSLRNLNVDDGRGELWKAGVGWTLLPGAPLTPLLSNVDINRSQEHPRMFVAPNGKLFVPGPTPNMQWYDVSGTGSVTSAGVRGAGGITDSFSQNDVTVMFAPGKLLKAGGNVNYDRTGAATTPSSATSYVIDINTNTAQVHAVPAMLRGRAFANGVVLPSGEVLVVGGLDNGKAFTDTGAVLIPELFDPATETWSDVTPMTVPRTYHSVALLMPDARVFVGGGGLCGEGCAGNHFDAEIFSPSYLLTGTRPAIGTAPTAANYAQSIAVTTTGTVNGFAWIRMSSVTHSMNTDQRRLPATFTPGSGGAFSVVTPANANLAPPGFYMLFALNGKTPSVAKIIQITAAGAPATPTTPPANAIACTSNPENMYATLTCPSGEIIKAIEFASFGNPTGQCGAYVKGTCDTPQTLGVFQTACVGMASCALPTNAMTLGDGCFGVSKILRLQARCGAGTVAPPPPSAVCATAAEWNNATLSCPAGNVITTIDFASYGNPAGACNNFTTGSCNAATSKTAVSSACLGKATCSVAATNTTFGDPCSGTAKQLYARASCGTGTTPPPGTGTTACASAAEWYDATLTCPSGTTVSSIDFASYGSPTGTCGNFATSTCSAANSKTVVSTACLGKASCAVQAVNTKFGGDPCSGTVKKLAFAATCK